MQEVDQSRQQDKLPPALPAERGADPPVERTVEETIVLHRGEWILMKVIGFDEDGWPERGLLLAHSPRRGDISEALRQEPPRSERPPDAPYEPYYVFNAFPRGR